MEGELYLELTDNEWPLAGIDHDRMIVRAILFDDAGMLHFIRARRDDGFGCSTLIETSGGGVEPDEDLGEALMRELDEELGAKVEVLCKIGIVDDYYNLIHRHNINNYYLCRATSFGEKNLTEDEIKCYHLSTLKLTYDEAVAEYERCRCTRVGRLVYNREMPVLKAAKAILDGK